MRSLELLIEEYKAEQTNYSVKNTSLSEKEYFIFNYVKIVWEIHLGRISTIKDSSNSVKTIDEILQCLKRVLKSVKKWNKFNGWQGYLKNISEFIL